MTARDNAPMGGLGGAWSSPLGGLIEARRLLQEAHRAIEQEKARNSHVPGNPYDVALSALQPALAELALLVEAQS